MSYIFRYSNSISAVKFALHYCRAGFWDRNALIYSTSFLLRSPQLKISNFLSSYTYLMLSEDAWAVIPARRAAHSNPPTTSHKYRLGTSLGCYFKIFNKPAIVYIFLILGTTKFLYISGSGGQGIYCVVLENQVNTNFNQLNPWEVFIFGRKILINADKWSDNWPDRMLFGLIDHLSA